MKLITRGSRRSGQRGASLLLVASAMFALLGITAFTVDFGRFYVVRGELQNAADSAALAGIGSIGNFYDQDWESACNAALLYASKNKVLKSAVASGDLTIDAGFWADEAFTTISSCDDLPIASYDTAEDELPAIRVLAERTSASESGAIATLFAPLLGKSFLETDAMAIAVVGTSNSGKGIPFAFSNCLKSALLNEDGSPKTDSPFTFRVYGTSSSGAPNDVACQDIGGGVYQGFAQWVSFCDISGCNGNNSVQNILSDPEAAVPVEPGDITDILDGANANLYNLIENATVLVPLLSETFLPVGQTNVTIENLIALRVTSTGNAKPVLNDPDLNAGNARFIEFVIADPVKFLEGIPDLEGPRTAGVMTRAILVN